MAFSFHEPECDRILSKAEEWWLDSARYLAEPKEHGQFSRSTKPDQAAKPSFAFTGERYRAAEKKAGPRRPAAGRDWEGGPMTKLLEKLRSVPLGRWVLIMLVVTMGVSRALQTNATAVRDALLGLREPRLARETQKLLATGEAAPQAFTRAATSEEAAALFGDLKRTGQATLARAQQFHCIDLGFMSSYGVLLVVTAIWARKRARLLAAAAGANSPRCTEEPLIAKVFGCLCSFCRWLGRAPGKLWLVAVVAAVVGVAGDLAEHRACTAILEGKIDQPRVDLARWAWSIKWIGVNVSTVIGPIGGVWASLLTAAVRDELLKIWGLTLCAHRFAMKARFSILAAALFAILLLTGPGEDIIRTVATGAFVTEKLPGPPEPDFARLGWFAVGLLLLAGSCWGWARLVLAVQFSEGEGTDREADDADANVEDRLRRDLPIYYGAAPFAAAACAFALAPLQESGSLEFPIAQFLAASLAPLLLFFILPLALVIFRASATTERTSFGPLCWTLSIYTALAAAHALANAPQLGVLGVVPIVLLVVALLIFGLGRPGGVLLLPLVLLVCAALFGGWRALSAAAAPTLVLCILGVLAFRAAERLRCSDALHIPLKFGTGRLLSLIFSETARESVRAKIRSDPPAQGKLRRQQAPSRAEKTDEALSTEAVDRLRGLLQFCALLLGFQIGFFMLVVWGPPFAPHVGSAAILALGLGGWATVGSVLIFLTQASRFPILAAALVTAVLCSAVMDNHAMRRTGPADAGFVEKRERLPEAGIDPIGKAFDEWQTALGPDAASCIIVAAEGGGIRAAMWPAIVLGTLQDRSIRDPRRQNRADFASHVFAISGVSGGSVGAAVFAAVSADYRESGKVREYGARICGQDHLAPTLGGLLYPDALQRFLPFSIFNDRASYFERSWETASILPPNQPAKTTRLAQPFTELWSDAGSSWRPALFLNTTMVENGKRAIVSNLPVRTSGGGQFIDAHDLHAHLRKFGPGAGVWQDVTLSTAAHASARFPLVSPPGRLPSGFRVVDGGYFENSAATTGLDVLNGVIKRMDAIRQEYPTKKLPKVIFVFLRYADVPVSLTA